MRKKGMTRHVDKQSKKTGHARMIKNVIQQAEQRHIQFGLELFKETRRVGCNQINKWPSNAFGEAVDIECGSIALSRCTREWVVIEREGEREWLNNNFISQNERIGTWYWSMQHIHVKREEEILAYLTASPYPGLTGGVWLITSTPCCQQLLTISIVCVTACIVADKFHA